MEYVIRKHIVARSFARLREQKTHPLFAGYLHLQQQASQLNRLTNLQPEFAHFYQRFFAVGNHPLGSPYIKLFTEQKASEKNLWLNENIAGSYAPSSLRPEQPFRQVVTIEEKKYSLPFDHAQRALKHLLYSLPIQVADLSVVLYRDFGLFSNTATIHDLINIFAYEFGYIDEPEAQPDKNFQVLYDLASAQNWEEDWLEAHE